MNHQIVVKYLIAYLLKTCINVLFPIVVLYFVLNLTFNNGIGNNNHYNKGKK